MKGNAVIVTALLGLLSCAAGMVIITAGEAPQPANECSKGPEYWCKDIRTAKMCRATKHCIQTVWERQAVPEDNDDICTICKDMVQQARDTLLSNETQEEMKEVFEGSCKLLPIKLVRVNCIKMVDDFVPELIEMLASQMNPTMVCTTAWLCNNQWTDSLQTEYKAAQKSESSVATGSCGQCRAFMTHNAEKLKASSLQDVQRVLFGVCGQLNSYSDACMALVNDNIEKIYNYIEEKLSSEACKPLGFCPAEESVRISVQPLSNDKKFEAKFEKNALTNKNGDDLECEFCQALIKNLRSILVSNTTEAEFVTVLRSICQQTGGFAQQCSSVVDMYAEVIYSFVVNELDPAQACRLLTLCPLPGLKNQLKVPLSYLRIEPEGREVIEATKIMPAKKVEEILSPLPIERMMPESLYEDPKKPGCILCEYVLKEVATELRNSTVEEEIEASLKTICHRLPLPIGNECTKLVEQYGDAILYMLAQELDPSVLCVELQMCPASPTAEVKLPEHPFKGTAEDPNACALCEFVVTMAEHRLENNHTEESVRKTLENICQHMPKSVRQDCTHLVDAYAKQIIEMLVSEFTPDEVCVGLKLCNPKHFDGLVDNVSAVDSGLTVGEFLEKVKQDKTPAVNEIAKTVEKNTPMCVMCEFAMATLEKKILNNKTEENVKRAIDFLCAHLPETVADMCIDFVEEYGDEIFKLITGQIAPKAVCIQLGVCLPEEAPIQKLYNHPFEQEPKKKLLGHVNEQKNVELSLPSKCEICEIVVEYLDKMLMDDTVEESIDHVIENACKAVPRGAKDKCTAMVETYGPYLIHQIGVLMDKTKVCQSLHLCKPPAGLVQLLGGIQCTWGPSYWCLSSEHASACNALEHCQQMVWLKSEP